MGRNIAIALLSVLAIGAGIWGYQEHKEKNEVIMQAENQYQNAFHALTYNMDLLHDKIGTTLAMNSQTQLSPALTDVWQLTAKTHGTIGQLPLSIIPFHETEQFLTNIGDFIDGAVIRTSNPRPLTEDEYKTLQSMYTQCEELQDELRAVQTSMLENNLKWNDVKANYTSGKGDQTIINGFKSMEDKATGYTKGNGESDPTFVSLKNSRRDLSEIKGEKITEQQALEIAKKYTSFEDNSNATVTKNKDGSSYEFYSVRIVEPNTNNEFDMDILVNGGLPIWLMNSESVNEKKISLDEGASIAAKFLEQNGYKNMDLYDSMEFNNIGVYTFVYTTDDIRIYSDNVKVNVALNDGHINGLNAKDFLISSKERQINKVVLSEEEAENYINPGVQIMEHRLALIENDRNEEVLCYEFLGTMNNDTYQIFINAENGIEEKVEKLTRSNKVLESFEKYNNDDDDGEDLKN